MGSLRRHQGLGPSRNCRLPRDLEARFVGFCKRTRRNESATMRAIVELFFEGSDDATCEKRLASGIWDTAELEARRRAEQILHEAHAAAEKSRPGRRKGA